MSLCCLSLPLSLFPWFYLSCLSSRLLWPLIRRFILHLICLSLLSRSSLLAGHGDLGPLRPHEGEKWCSGVILDERERDRQKMGSPPVAGGDSVAPELEHREGESVCVSVSLSRWHWSAVPYSAGTLKRITDSNDQHSHLLSHVPCLGIYGHPDAFCPRFDLASVCRSGPGGGCPCAACTMSSPAQQEKSFSSMLPAGTGL